MIKLPAAPGRRVLESLALALALGMAAPPAVAQTQPGAPPAAPSAQKQNSAQPIEIVADSLVVEQDKQLATFTGNVDAVQGTMKLKSDRLVVLYDQGDSNGAAAPATGGGQGMRRLEATGNVFLDTDKDTARGDHGVYDVPAGLITLDGNVVLTRGPTVIHGARLESNTRTGVSTVTAAEPAAGKPADRVRALFTPAAKKAP